MIETIKGIGSKTLSTVKWFLFCGMFLFFALGFLTCYAIFK